MVELVFPSPTSMFSTPQKIKITNIIDIPSPNLKRKSDLIEIDTARKINLKQKNKLIHNKITHISKLKKRVITFKTHNNVKNSINMHNFPSINSKSIVTMQLKDRRRPWTLNEKNLALNLYYKSPTAYTFLRTQKVNLPGHRLFVVGLVNQNSYQVLINYFSAIYKKDLSHPVALFVLMRCI